MLADDPLIGRFAGRYRIERLLARGGMGLVYAAVQPEIGSRTAIKILDEKATEDPELVERFFSEARAVNLIAHENIVKVLDLAWLDDGRPYIVMEYVDGITLTQATRGGRAPLGGVVRVLADVLSALAAAHERGIVHRDLKPDNILVTGKGHAKVLDFGIAKLAPQHLHTAAARTATGALLGTPAYMAPEQISGARDVDARADIYSAGAVLFFAVTGRPPFDGATIFDIMRAHVEEPAPPVRSLRPDAPALLAHVIAKALAKDPAQRFQTAAEMSAALEAASAEIPDGEWAALGSGARASQPPPRETPPAMSAVTIPAAKSRRWLFAVAALGVLAAIAAVVMRPASAPLDPPVVQRAAIAPPDAAPIDTPEIDATVPVDAMVRRERPRVVPVVVGDAAVPDAAAPDALYVVKQTIEIPNVPDDELTIEQLQVKYRTEHVSRPKHDVPTRAEPYAKYIGVDFYRFDVRGFVDRAAEYAASIPTPKPGKPALLAIHVDFAKPDGTVDLSSVAVQVEYVFRLASATSGGCIAKVLVRSPRILTWVESGTSCTGVAIGKPRCNPSQLPFESGGVDFRSYMFDGKWRSLGNGEVSDSCN